MQRKIKKCQCESTTFWVTEDLIWEAIIDQKTKELDCTDGQSKISKIECQDCGKEYKDGSFNQINFN